jgi:hypothetical protein
MKSIIKRDACNGILSKLDNVVNEPRLLRSRRYRHGLSNPPALKNPTPRKDRAFIACPLANQGVCRYREAYCCNDVVQAMSRERGHCLIEQGRHDLVVAHALDILDRPRLEDVPEGLRTTILLWAEASVYRMRALFNMAWRTVDKFESPAPEVTMRYVLASGNVLAAREEAFLEEAERELHRHPGA